jgi:hypothetical protein
MLHPKLLHVRVLGPHIRPSQHRTVVLQLRYRAVHALPLWLINFPVNYFSIT